MGVWIETLIKAANASHELVTPCVGVWIETLGYNLRYWQWKSHPAWVCGLKLQQLASEKSDLTSHPAWVCGLKP